MYCTHYIYTVRVQLHFRGNVSMFLSPSYLKFEQFFHALVLSNQKLISVRRACVGLGVMLACVLVLNVNTIFAAYRTEIDGTAGCLARTEPEWLSRLYYFNNSLVSMAVPTALTLALNLSISAVIVARTRRGGHLQHRNGALSFEPMHKFALRCDYA